MIRRTGGSLSSSTEPGSIGGLAQSNDGGPMSLLIRTMSRMMETIAETSVQHLQPEHPTQREGAVGPCLRADAARLHGSRTVRASRRVPAHPRLGVGPGARDAHGRAGPPGSERDGGVDGFHGQPLSRSAWTRITRRSARRTHTTPASRPGRGPPDRPDSPGLHQPPFDSEYKAEYLGTTVAFNYLNRVVSVFLGDSMMPTPEIMAPVTDRMATTMMAAMIVKRNVPGEGVALVPTLHRHARRGGPRWAEGTRHMWRRPWRRGPPPSRVWPCCTWSPGSAAWPLEVIDAWDGTPPPVDERMARPPLPGPGSAAIMQRSSWPCSRRTCALSGRRPVG